MTLTLFDLAGIDLEPQAAPVRTRVTPPTPRAKAPVAEALPSAANSRQTTISTPQHRLIQTLLNERPDRVELIRIVLGEQPEGRYAHPYSIHYFARRETYLHAIKQGDVDAILRARVHSMEPTIAALYQLFRSPRSHTMRYADASRFIQWLKYEKPVRPSTNPLAPEEDYMLHYPTKLPVWGRTL